MENSKKANATNDDINLRADALTDLPVAERQADETKAGTGLHAWHEDFIVVGNSEEEKHFRN